MAKKASFLLCIFYCFFCGKLFAESNGYTIFYKNRQIPDDVKSWFSIVTDAQPIADYGEPWEPSDRRGAEKLPIFQHVYSAVSQEKAVVIYRRGGFSVVQNILVVDRQRFDMQCVYPWEWVSVDVLDKVLLALSDLKKLNEQITEANPMLKGPVKCMPVKVGDKDYWHIPEIYR